MCIELLYRGALISISSFGDKSARRDVLVAKCFSRVIINIGRALLRSKKWK